MRKFPSFVSWIVIGAAALTAPAAEESQATGGGGADEKPAKKVRSGGIKDLGLLDGFSIGREASAVEVKSPGGNVVLRYETERPRDSKLTVESGCYFHPVATPSGVVVTEVAPSDHLHHRGIFLGWVEMHGAKDADFWGWGEHAPKAGRRIANREVTDLRAGARDARFRAENEWIADGEVLVKEDLEAKVRAEQGANVLDLRYTLTAGSDTTLARWAFSGFCVRLRKDGEVEATGPKGRVDLPDPVHTKPETDWPAAAWYDFTLKLPGGKVAGAAVLDHPGNPPSLWHNHRGLRMLNPAIVAPAAFVLKAGKPLLLRYTVVVHDGPAPQELLERLAKEQAASADAGGAGDERTNSIGMEFRTIPAGEFEMDYTDEPVDRDRGLREPWEPAPSAKKKKVRIEKPFLIARFEVSEADFEGILGRKPKNRVVDSIRIGGDEPGRPALNVSWDEAQEFSKKLSELPEEKKAGRRYRLPAEAELERAKQTAGEDSFTRFDWHRRIGHWNIWEFCADPPASEASLPPGKHRVRLAYGTPDVFMNAFTFRVVLDTGEN